MMTIIQVETREEKRQRRKWTPWIRSLQKMVQVSTKRKVSEEGSKILAERGLLSGDPAQNYTRLVGLLERAR